MADRLSDAELEETLRDVGRHLAYPDGQQLAARVRARLAADRARRRPWILALAPAALTLLVIGAGATAAEIVRLRGVDVFRVPDVRALPQRDLDLGERVPLEAVPDARRSSDPLFARPDAVHLRRGAAGDEVAFVYAARPGLPAGPTGHGALVTQFSGSLDAGLIGKGVGPGTRYEQVSVAGRPAIWIEGPAHLFLYRDARGRIVEGSLRLAGNTLLWETDRGLMRLEAQVPKARALELAASFR